MASSTGSRKKNRSARTRRHKLVLALCFVICAYLLVSIASIQIEIYRENRKLEQLRELINERQLENDELSRIILNDGEEEYIERIAREKLGYAAPDERVFEDASGT